MCLFQGVAGEIGDLIAARLKNSKSKATKTPPKG
jgi:hypothetical protein